MNGPKMEFFFFFFFEMVPKMPNFVNFCRCHFFDSDCHEAQYRVYTGVATGNHLNILENDASILDQRTVQKFPITRR
jgi:hypothetical protein